MRTLAQVIALDHALRGQRVLSAYVDRAASSPATARAWRAQLNQWITRLRDGLSTASHAEREEFERCVAHLNAELVGLNGVGAPGLAVFATQAGVHETVLLPVPVPTRAAWGTGPLLAPSIRTLKEARQLILAVVDSRHARIYRYVHGELERVAALHAHHALREPAHMGAEPRRGFHNGTRGETGHDAAQRGRLAGRQHMLELSAARILKLAGAESWIAVGGIQESARALFTLLEPAAAGRLIELDGLDVHVARNELTQAARSVAATMQAALDRDAINDIVDHEAITGVATLGPEETNRALDERRVRSLYFTQAYLGNHPIETEAAVRSAIAQDADVEEVSGEAAALLDSHGGISTRLRYRRP